ncbi:hypothetical protein CERSUDRAFT_83694 [Gelatoporia subvermispora B]|uniref:Uncharacterized protein n=1 Tax=Ceriporiopsis subvermispora (strain B) TaxID=914234 RepID=M2QHY7_CERS8|nr:hypothetical protein CERSUDRAFT_83694 [Gelatoporia subvermispora B]
MREAYRAHQLSGILEELQPTKVEGQGNGGEFAPGSLKHAIDAFAEEWNTTTAGIQGSVRCWFNIGPEPASTS